jgi:hypothetical protein
MVNNGCTFTVAEYRYWDLHLSKIVQRGKVATLTFKIIKASSEEKEREFIKRTAI